MCNILSIINFRYFEIQLKLGVAQANTKLSLVGLRL